MAKGIPDYDELRVRIEPGPAEGAYHVLAFGPEGSTASGTFVVPFTSMELDNFILRVGLPRRSVRSFRSAHMEEAKRFGAKLFAALVQGDVAEAYVSARQAASAQRRGLRLTLQLTNVPTLMEIPWEFLYERPRFLSQSIYSPVVRSLDLKSVRPPRQVTLPLRILGVVSSPRTLPPLNVAEERRRLEGALSSLTAQATVELSWLEKATMSELDRVVGAPDELHIIHYIGHGAYDERTAGGLLVLEDDRGDPHEVTGEELGSLLHDEHSLGLAVLNACEGARTSHVDPFSGVASSLVEAGIPAVVGMQFEVTDVAAIAFAERLYSSLAQGFPVDAALARARMAIFAAGHDIEFGTPVLFLRSGATRLFEIGATVAAEKAGTSRVPITARVEQPPRLVVESPSIDFGDVESGTRSPPRLIRLSNAGGGRLDATATTSAAWLEADLHGDELLVRAAALPPGQYSGAVTVESAGGRVDISAKLHVHPTPNLPTIPLEVPVLPHPAPSPTPGPAWRQRRGLLITAAAVSVGIVVTAITLVILPETDGSGGSGDRSETTSAPTPTSTTTAPVSLEWQPASALLEPLEAAGIAVLDGKVWVVGGNSPDADRHALKTVQIYDPARPTDGWQPGTPLEEGLDGAAVASDGERLYVVGGRTGQQSNWEYSAEMYVLDGAADTKWDRLESSLPEPRYAGAIAWDGSRLVFAGGRRSSEAVEADVWEWEPDGQWLPVGNGELTQPRDDLAVATDGDGRVWFLGGGDGQRGHVDTVDRIEGDRIEAASDIPPVRASAAVWLPGRGVCLFGGMVPEGNSEVATDAVTCLEPGPQLPPLASPRAGTGAVLNDAEQPATIYVAGGFGPGASGMDRVDRLVIPQPPASSS